MDNSKIDFTNSVVLSMIKTANYLVKIGDQFFKPYNVTAAQYNLLIVLKNSEKKLNQQDVSTRLVVSKSDITGIVDRLEKMKYVKRFPHEHDRRIKLLEINEKGLSLVKQVEGDYFNKLKEVTNQLSLSDLKQLDRLISKFNIINNFIIRVKY